MDSQLHEACLDQLLYEAAFAVPLLEGWSPAITGVALLSGLAQTDPAIQNPFATL